MPTVVTILLLSAHLLCVGLAMIGPLVCVWLEVRYTRGDALSRRLSLDLAKLSLAALVLGTIFGGALLALRFTADNDRYFSALSILPQSRLWFALAELVFYLVCIGIYYAAWDRMRAWRSVHRLLGIAAASNLMIHFPALFIIIALVVTRPELTGHTLDRADFQRLLLDKEVIARVVHIWLAATAITGAALIALCHRLQVSDPEASSRETVAQRAGALAGSATMLQFPVGLWVLMVMPEAARRPILGADPIDAGLFIAALAMAMYLAHVLSSVSLGSLDRNRVLRATCGLVLIVVIMVSLSCRVRQDLWLAN